MKATAEKTAGRAAVLGLAVLLLALPACARRRKEQQKTVPPEQVYAMAMQKIEKKHYYTARNLLQQILPTIPPEDRDLLPRVQLAIADAYFFDKGLLNYGEALNGYRNFLTYFPNHEKADHAQFMVGMSLYRQVPSPDRDQAMTLKAIDEFRKVEAVYPASPYVVQARQMIEACLGRLADHERLVGAFYQRRGAWQAAIDRYQVILDKYPNYRHTEVVLFDLGRCLLRVGNRQDAEAAFDRLRRDDPDGPLSLKTKKILERYDREQVKRWAKANG